MTPTSYIRLALPVLAAVLSCAVAGAQPGGFRVGVEFGNPAVALILRPPPLDLRLGYDFLRSRDYLFVSADFRIVDRYPLAGSLGLFVSAGAYAAIERAAPNRYRIGLRLPAGLQMFLAGDAVELFVEAVPILEIYPGVAFNLAGMQGYAGLTVGLPGFGRQEIVGHDRLPAAGPDGPGATP